MKKFFAFILILALVLALSVPALAEPEEGAPEICVSNQSLEINGRKVACSAYNIDGYNYFRLRELASLLAGTENRFNVEYDEATDTVYIIPGEDYLDPTPLASYNMPFEPVETTRPYFCPSVQNLVFDGHVVKTIDAWNISDNNYFKLADLAGLLGFALAYDEATRTVKITTYETKGADPADYQDIYAAVSAAGGSRYLVTDEAVAAAEAPAPVPAPASGASDMKAEAAEEEAVTGNSKASADSGYSGTNVQVEGIDEGDIVKTDVKYIYVLRDGEELTILKADGKNSSVISRTEVGSYSYTEDKENGYYYAGESKSAQEMFVSDGRLAVISDYSSYEEWSEDGKWNYESENYTCIDIYDVTDPAAPELLDSFGQDGYVSDTRMLNGKVYVASDYWVWNGVEDDPSTYVPVLYRNGIGKVMPADCVYISPDCESSEYVVLCCYDLGASKLAAGVSQLGGCDDLYMNEEHIYTFNSRWTHSVEKQYKESVYTVTEHLNTSETCISRFDVADGLQLYGTTVVPGYIDGQFSADEFNGYLRVVTTRDDNTYRTFEDEKYGFVNYIWDDDFVSNGLYILSPELKVVGKVDELAEDEYVYSARFDGEIAYFCTYRSVDPLFAVDCSDPAAPKVLSALKISGFSDYLHSWGGDRLFGFGQETNEETDWNEGLKLVMFNTADKTDVYVENYLVLDASYSEALYNHKAFFIDKAKNIIGFLGENDYYIFSYTPEDGFRQLSHFTFDTYEWNVRGLWIDHWAYIVGREQAMIVDMNTWGAPTGLKLSE